MLDSEMCFENHGILVHFSLGAERAVQMWRKITVHHAGIVLAQNGLIVVFCALDAYTRVRLEAMKKQTPGLYLLELDLCKWSPLRKKTVFYANKKLFMLRNRMPWVVVFLFVCVICPNVVN